VVDFNHDLEDELREGLYLRQPSEGFADRLMARFPEQKSRGRVITWPQWKMAIAASLIAAAAIGGYAAHHRQVEGERAREQVLLALRITHSTLDAVQQKISTQQEQSGNSEDQP
jgi:hypothetical protein